MLFIRRALVSSQHLRLYHQSRFQTDKKVSVVKRANIRAQKTLGTKLDQEVNSKVGLVNPAINFEPFPFAVTEDNKVESLRKVLTPLYDVPYEEQIASKESFCRNALRNLARELYKSGTAVRLDVKRLPCHVNPMVKAPQLTHYRCKDEFSIWRGLDGQTVTAGFLIFPIGKHGDSVCVEPDGCDVVRQESIQACSIINEFLRNKAELSPCYSLGTDGGWRRFGLRVNTDGEVMLIGYMSPRGLRVQQVLNERDNFRDFMIQRFKDKNLRLTSLYYQPCPQNHCRHQDVPYELLHGKPSIEEKIGKFKFLLSPESFIHDSPKGAEVLYETVKKTIDECFSFKERGVRPLIIDARCGIGALAINLADVAEHVVGVDDSSMSIDDARANAKLNDVQNVEFVCSNLEIVLERILTKYSKFRGEILVVCDTPKSGLHNNVIDVLRHHRDVNKILIISPKVDGLRMTKNLMNLCGKSQQRSLPPFAPLLATPVDTYPHIEIFQTILALERLPE